MTFHREVILDFLPQDKYQVIGMVVYILADSFLEYWLGKNPNVKASSKLEFILILGAAAVIAVAEIFKREKKNGS